MENSDTKALVIDYIEAIWNRSDPDSLERLTAPSFAYRLGEQPARDRASMRQFLEGLRAAFPDWHVEIVELVAEHETVAVRWSATATHHGAFHGIAPTGRRIRVSGINMYRVAAGAITEEWEQMDSLGLLRQLGALPAE